MTQVAPPVAALWAQTLIQAWSDDSGLCPLAQAKVTSTVQGQLLTVHVSVPYAAAGAWTQWQAALHDRVQAALPQAVPSATTLLWSWSTDIRPHAVRAGNALIGGVKNIIAVASGKGGVGKSTTAVNLALALHAQGARVGLLDADIYGPSLAMMLGVKGRPQSDDGKTMNPMLAHGLQMISMGVLTDPDSPMIWRGPMATQALDQLLRQTQWQDLDYLIVDMPPGTGDIALSLSQRVPLTGAVIVTTPQDIALLDARKGLRMFEKVSVPILGVVENMSMYCCPNCGHSEAIFGEAGGHALAQDHHVPLLAQLPLAAHIRMQTDSGQPTMVSDPQSAAAQLYVKLALRLGQSIAALAQDHSHKFPSIRISPQT